MPVDLIGGSNDGHGGVDFRPQGSVAERFLSSGGNMSSFRTCAEEGGILRRDDWESYDRIVLQTANENMSLIPDIIAGGGIHNLGTNPMGVMSLVWDKQSRYEGANVDMTAETDDEFDRLVYEQDRICIPIVHNGFRLNLRSMVAATNNGGNLQLDHAASATKAVARTLELMAMAEKFSAGDNLGTVYGMLTFPGRTAFTLTGDWRTLTGQQIYNDVNAMLQAQVDNLQFSNENVLYLPNIYMSKLNEQYAIGTDVHATIREKIMSLPMIKDIRFHFGIKGNNVAMCPLTKEVVDVVNGIQPQMIHWSDKGGMVSLFKIIAILPVRWKQDIDGVSGLVHGSA